MPGKHIHQLAGAITGLAVSQIDNEHNKQSTLHNPLATASIGAFAGRLPDLIEPAINPHHRQFFHSFVVMAGVGYGVKKIYDWEPETGIEKGLRILALVGGVAYLSHLVLDAGTPRSLPLVGKL